MPLELHVADCGPCCCALQSRIGPPKTMCYQTQRYTMYKDDNFVFETFQVGLNSK